MIEISYFAAFLVGLLGGVHCVGMCGGIVATLSIGLPEERRMQWRAQLPYLISYNSGRLMSYTIAGLLVGGAGAWMGDLLLLQQAKVVMQTVAGLFMVALGLYLGGWWFGLTGVEKLGGFVWRFIEPFARKLLPIRSVSQALTMGLVWGWLPCGLVYSVLIWAISAGSALQGGLLLLAFGLGTLPNLFAMGLVAGKVSGWIRQPLVTHLAGGVVVLMGLFYIVTPHLNR
ncbi:MAG: sulfite exporter TauE/SafE family protein [Gammaproteobacteria bacterium]|nr:sulfite exporter TauE/SafE family protein [Gammaproteobacteria bacterium]